MRLKRKFTIKKQPDDTSCGPTCLHSIYNYYGNNMPLDDVIKKVRKLKDGGTLATLLGIDALKKGYKATIYTYNIQIFDPTWFNHKKVDLIKKLHQQMNKKPAKKKLIFASNAAIEFLRLGGHYRFQELTQSLIRKYLKKDTPILTGLSATYLYRTSREDKDTNKYDDIGGFPSGHFVVLCGYNKETKEVLVADPLLPNPVSKAQIYPINIQRVINAILLGILTHDANLLVIELKNRH